MTKLKSEFYYVMFYVGALGLIALFALATHAIIDTIVAEQARAATVITDTGRQRMLSQRIFGLSFSLSNSGDEQVQALLMGELESASAIMRATHNMTALTGEVPDTPIPRYMRVAGERVYFAEPFLLDRKVQLYLDNADAFMRDFGSPQADQNLAVMATLALRDLVVSYDRLVAAYEDAVHNRIANLRSLLWWFLGAMMVLLVAEAIFVFRPLFRRIMRQKRELFDMALTDALTGCPNRRNFFEHGETMFQLTKRHGGTFSVLAFDIDKFKSVNDTYGHDVGDEVIRALARMATGMMRETDLFARLGGEEFFALLPETSYEDARQVAEKIRIQVQDTPCHTPTATVVFTCSVGVAELIDGDETLHDMMNRADAALYVAKNSGRNRVELAVPHGMEAPVDGEVDFDIDLSELDELDIEIPPQST